MEIYVTVLSDRCRPLTLTLAVEPSDTLAAILAMVQATTGIPRYRAKSWCRRLRQYLQYSKTLLAYNIDHETKLYVILGAQDSKNAVAYHIESRDPEPASCGNSVTNGIHVRLSREVQWLRLRDAIMLRSTHHCRLVAGYSSFNEDRRMLSFCLWEN